MSYEYFDAANLEVDLLKEKWGVAFLPVLLLSCASNRISDFSRITSNPLVWIPANQISDFHVQHGVMKGFATGEDPFIVVNDLRLKGKDIRFIQIRLKSNFGSRISIYWNEHDDSEWSETRTIKTSIVSDGEFHNYILPVGLHKMWRNSTIRSIRLDPSEGDNGGSFEIEWIKLQQLDDGNR